MKILKTSQRGRSNFIETKYKNGYPTLLFKQSEFFNSTDTCAFGYRLHIQPNQRKNIMKTLLLIICSIVVLIPATMLLMTAYEEAKATRKLESQCINKHIQLGIERRNINVSNGTCSLRSN